MSTNPVIGQMKGLTFTQYQIYTAAVGTFNRVQAYNLNVSTLRSAGNSQLSYYQFISGAELEAYKMGMCLLVTNDPRNAASYAPVPQD
jgi:hypothetical protein